MSVHGRDSQLKTLLAAFGTDDKTHLPPSIFLWGMSSTGKTFILNQALKEAAIVRTAKLSATEIMCGRRPFFETLLRQLQPGLPPNLKSDNLRLFIRSVGEFVKDLPLYGKERIVIVLDDAEQLRGQYSDILDVLVNLQESIQANFCVIISSFLPPTNFSSISNMRCLPSIHFPQYSKDEVIKIITTCYPQTLADPEVYKFYVGMLVNVFYQASRDLRKLLRLTKSNWEYFYHDCSSEGQNNLRKIWKTIEPKLKADFKALSSQLLPMPESEPLTSRIEKNPGVRNYDDIPKYSRYLLIASYLATHNPPSSDKRFFVKASTGRGRKRNRLGAQVDNENTMKAGSVRSFEQSRLKAIFGFLVRYCSTSGSEIYEDNVDLLVQLTTLCQARFIQSLGEDSSGNYKYRCLADYDFVQEVAHSVNFEVEKFLYRLL